MTPAARLSAAIEILDRILAGAPAEQALTNWGRANRFAGSGDRHTIGTLVFDNSGDHWVEHRLRTDDGRQVWVSIENFDTTVGTRWDLADPSAVHGGPDSRTLPNSQSAEEVAAVIAGVIESRAKDVYTRPGAKQMVLGYLDGLMADPPA